MFYFKIASCKIGILLCCSGFFNTTNAANLTLMVGDNPPFNAFRGAQAEGMAVEVVAEMLKRSQITAEQKNFPWARALSMAQNAENHCAFTVGRIPEREKLFQWIGPIDSVKGTFFGLRERNLQVKNLNDAKKLRIGDLRQGANALWLESKGFTIDYANSEKQNLLKLLAGHIDLYPGTPYSAREIALRMQIDPRRFQAVLVFNQVDLYLACNLKLKPNMIDKLKQALASMQADKKLQQIKARYDAKFALPNN